MPGLRANRSVWQRAYNPLLALAFAGAYLTLGLRDLSLPGPYSDELYQVIPAVHILTGAPPGPSGPPELNLKVADRYFPLFTDQGYLGALKTYAILPALAIAGIDITSVRLTSLLAGAAGVAFAFLFLVRFAGLLAAVIATGLLATDPSYLFHTRLDWGPVALMMALKSLSLYSLWRWWTGDALGWLAAGAFALGLGIYDKFNFCWFLIAVGLSVVLLARSGLARRIDAQTACVGGALLFLGAAPVVAANALVPGWSVRSLALVLHGSPIQAGLATMSAGFLHKLTMVHGVLKGDIVPDWVLGAPGDIDPNAVLGTPLQQASALPVLLVFALILYVILASLRWQSPSYLTRAAVCLLLPSLVFAQILLTPQADGPHHAMMIYPFPQFLIGMTMGAALTGPQDQGKRFLLSVRRALLLTLLFLVFAGQLLVSNEALTRLATSGSRGNWSDSIHEVVNYLMQEAKDEDVVTLDWGIRNNLVFISHGQLRVIEPQVIYEIHFGEPTPAHRAQLRELLLKYRWFVQNAPAGRNFREAGAMFAQERGGTG